MDILIILALSLVTFFVAKTINEKTGIAVAILYIITGIIIGIIMRNMGTNAIIEVLPNIDRYSNVLLLLMFFSAGFSINISAIAKSGSTIPKLAFIPSIVETFVVGTLMYFLIKFFGAAINIQLNIFETILISGILALSSTANVVPYCIELIQGNYKSKNNIQNTMLAVSVSDGFSTLPIIILALFLSIEKSKNIAFTGSTVVFIIIGVLFAIIASCVLGYFVGKLVNLVIKPLLENLLKDKENKTKIMLTTLCVFTVSYFLIVALTKVPVIGGAVATLNILIMCAIGAGISHFDTTGGSKLVSATGNKIFAILGTPIVFLSVGTKLDLKTLFNPSMLLIGLVTCCVAIVVKGGVAVLLLNKDTYTKEERKFVFACFIPKGLALVNFSVIFTALVAQYHAENLIKFMIMLAGITIIVSIPIGVTLLAKAKDTWFTK